MKPSKILIWLVLFAFVSSQNGCMKGLFRAQSADDKDDEEEAKTQLIGDYVTIAGLYPIQIEGVGLVVNLDNTGGDPPPSLYRTMLLNDMRKREVKEPNTLLQSPTTALVLIRASLPPVIQVGDKFDLEVVLPEGTDATSLNGGHLMQADLSEQAIVPGRGPIAGHKMAIAQGPILISTRSGDKVSLSGLLKRGKVLGGGTYLGGNTKKERMLGLYLRNDFRSVRNSKRVADRIGRRFNAYEKGLKKPLAKAMTDQHIELKVHPRYKDNYIRYVQVIRNIALRETPAEERDRMERLKKTLMVPQTASKSALELEAIGTETIPILKEGLKSPVSEVRFYSADALAYLGDATGAAELAAAAENEEAFRVFALAALAIIDEGATHELLRDLMNEYDAKTLARIRGEDPDETDRPEGAAVTENRSSGAGEGNSTAKETAKETANENETVNKVTHPKENTQKEAAPKDATAAKDLTKDLNLSDLRRGAETRYGAFRALWTLDKNDPFIRGEKLRDEFMLHVLKTEGEPMIHLTRNRHAEIVLFGADQDFRTPIALSAGRHIVLNAPAGSDTVTISRFEAGKPDQQRITSTRVSDVIRAVGSLGATYPDVAQMLTQAKRQSNAAGRLEVDALPQSGRIYHRPPPLPGMAGPRSKSKTKVGRASMVPNLFPSLKNDSGAARRELEEEDEADVEAPVMNPDRAGEASVADARSSDDDEPAKKPGRFSKLFKNPLKRAAN